VKPAKVSGPFPALNHEAGEAIDSVSAETLYKRRNLIASLMLSKPLLALHWSCMKMQLDAPVVVSQQSKGSLFRISSCFLTMHDYFQLKNYRYFLSCWIKYRTASIVNISDCIIVLICGLCSTCIMQFYVNSVDIHAVGRHFNVQVNHCFWMTSFDLFFWIVKLTASSSKQKIGRFFLYSSSLQKKKVYIPKAWTNQRNKQSDAIFILGYLRTAFSNSNPTLLTSYNWICIFCNEVISWSECFW
jgi:hypothetical protein